MATKRRVSAAEVAQQSQPKTTRPEAKSRRAPQIMPSTEEKIGVKLDAFPDRIDIRDWPYQPRLAPLPDQLIHCELVPEILDQGQEGACTGFALAAVINFLLHRRSIRRRVSPRMLYELARRYDEWPGEDYEGSSARGFGVQNTVLPGSRTRTAQHCRDPANLSGGTPGNHSRFRSHGTARDHASTHRRNRNAEQCPLRSGSAGERQTNRTEHARATDAFARHVHHRGGEGW